MEGGPADIQAAIECLVDEIYDEASPQTLHAIADGEPWNMDPDDLSIINDANLACESELKR